MTGGDFSLTMLLWTCLSGDNWLSWLNGKSHVINQAIFLLDNNVVVAAAEGEDSEEFLKSLHGDRDKTSLWNSDHPGNRMINSEPRTCELSRRASGRRAFCHPGHAAPTRQPS